MASAAVALAVTAGFMPSALADAAGPTDYRTDIVSIEPATSAISVEMIGGDSFLRLEQNDAVEVVVLGYQGEPYLRFAPDGRVFENRRSPATWLNQERFGEQEAPAFARPDARPEWFEIADSGSYSWHDHRSHWMNPNPPPSAEAGDQVLEAAVPIEVDGQSVTITVASYLLESPSNWPAVAGLVAALITIGVVLANKQRLSRALVAAAAGLLAVTLGFIAFRSVPAETEPSALLWLLPLLAVVAALALILLRNRTATTVYLDGLGVAGGALLLGWGILRVDALQRALIPSDAPSWLDRFGITSVALLGLAIAAQSLLGLFQPQRLALGTVAASRS